MDGANRGETVEPKHKRVGRCLILTPTSDDPQATTHPQPTHNHSRFTHARPHVSQHTPSHFTHARPRAAPRGVVGWVGGGEPRTFTRSHARLSWLLSCMICILSSSFVPFARRASAFVGRARGPSAMPPGHLPGYLPVLCYLWLLMLVCDGFQSPTSLLVQLEAVCGFDVELNHCRFGRRRSSRWRCWRGYKTTFRAVGESPPLHHRSALLCSAVISSTPLSPVHPTNLSFALSISRVFY
jgi:hypothetical protein